MRVVHLKFMVLAVSEYLSLTDLWHFRSHSNYLISYQVLQPPTPPFTTTPETKEFCNHQCHGF